MNFVPSFQTYNEIQLIGGIRFNRTLGQQVYGVQLVKGCQGDNVLSICQLVRPESCRVFKDILQIPLTPEELWSGGALVAVDEIMGKIYVLLVSKRLLMVHKVVYKTLLGKKGSYIQATVDPNAQSQKTSFSYRCGNQTIALNRSYTVCDLRVSTDGSSLLALIEVFGENQSAGCNSTDFATFVHGNSGTKNTARFKARMAPDLCLNYHSSLVASNAGMIQQSDGSFVTCVKRMGTGDCEDTVVPYISLVYHTADGLSKYRKDITILELIHALGGKTLEEKLRWSTTAHEHFEEYATASLVLLAYTQKNLFVAICGFIIASKKPMNWYEQMDLEPTITVCRRIENTRPNAQLKDFVIGRNNIYFNMAESTGTFVAKLRMNKGIFKNYRQCANRECKKLEHKKTKNIKGKRTAEFQICRICKELMAKGKKIQGSTIRCYFCSMECVRLAWNDHKKLHFPPSK